MNLGDIFGEPAKPTAPTAQPAIVDLDATEQMVVVGGDPSPPPVPPSIPITDEHLQILGEAAIRATDEAREADAKAKAARRLLEKALDAAGLKSLVVNGRECPIESDNRPEMTLKALKQILGEADGQKTWDALPRRPYRRIEIPRADSVEPLD